MACERWCFNRGCDDGATRRWLFVLLVGLCVLGSGLAFAEADPSYYAYAVSPRGKTLIEYRSPQFSFVTDDEEALVRRRRASAYKTDVTTEQVQPEHADQQPPSQQPQQQEQATPEQADQQHQPPPSLQPLQQKQQPQQQPQYRPSLLNASNATANVSYSTDPKAAGAQDQPVTASPTTEPSTIKPESPKEKKNTSVIVSQPMNPSIDEPARPTVWANRTMWDNATNKATPGKAPVTEVTEQTPASESPEGKDKSDADIGDISISKFSDLTNKTLSQHNITKTEHDVHQYYNSTFITDEAVGRRYWVDMDNHPELKVNKLLSQSHRRAATVKLKFDFPFYGHKVRNITIATGGFLYTGEYVHSWLAATQYIAPLMANFDTRLSNESYVKYADNGTAFTVEWEKVVLQDNPEDGAFTFQVTLHQNGDIVFVYSVIPTMVEKIEDTAHPVKVGLSDAYIMDRIVFFVRRKTIYEYHRVNFDRQDIRNWTVIYLHALPTCLEMDNCRDCLTKLKDFECKWCSELNLCSTGTFRLRQDWLLKGCDIRKVNGVDNCPSPTTTYKEHEEGYDHDGHVRSDETVTVSENSVKQERPGASPLERSRDNMNMGVSGIIGILVVIALVVGLLAWAAYAYRNPHSASGQMLIRYRPSQWSWQRRGEARYTAATIHM